MKELVLKRSTQALTATSQAEQRAKRADPGLTSCCILPPGSLGWSGQRWIWPWAQEATARGAVVRGALTSASGWVPGAPCPGKLPEYIINSSLNQRHERAWAPQKPRQVCREDVLSTCFLSSPSYTTWTIPDLPVGPQVVMIMIIRTKSLYVRIL